MRNIAVALMLLASVAGAAVAAGFRNVQSVEARKFMEKSGNVFLLDVRTPDEYRQARLKGAVLIPVGEIERRIVEVPKNRPILVYCAGGYRSAIAASLLERHGFRQVSEIAGGIAAWEAAKLPIETGAGA